MDLDSIVKGVGMLSWLFFSCSTTQDCSKVQCSCAIAEGSVLIDAVSTAKLHIFDYKNKKNERTIECESDVNGAKCTLSTNQKLLHAEVEVGANSFPVEIQVTQKTNDDCCQCGYLEFTPNHISIPYR